MSLVERLLFKKATLPREQKSASVTFSNTFVNWLNSIGQTTRPLEAYNVVPDVFAITDYTISQIAKLPLRYEDAQGEEIQGEHDLKNLVKQPNYYQNWPELVKQFFGYYEVLANAYLYRAEGSPGKIASLYVIPTPGTEVVLLRNKETSPSWLNEIAGYKFDYNGTKYNFTADQVLMKRYINLRYQNGVWVYGISKYIPGEKINSDLRAIYDARTHIVNARGALGVLSNETGDPDEEQSKIVQDALNRGKYGIKTGQDRFIVSTQKLSWVQMAMNIQELQLIENANFDFNKLCQLNGIDPVIFSTEGSTYANKEQARKDFISSVLVPKVNDFYQDLNEWLSPYFNGAKVLVDWSKVEEIREDLTAKSTMLINQVKVGIVTPRQAAEMLYNTESEAPDDYFLLSNMVPAEKVLNPEPAINVFQTTPPDEEEETTDEKLRRIKLKDWKPGIDAPKIPTNTKLKGNDFKILYNGNLTKVE